MHDTFKIFVSCPEDPDFWMRPANKNDKSDYYEYVILYTCDLLVVSYIGEKLTGEEIGIYFELKE